MQRLKKSIDEKSVDIFQFYGQTIAPLILAYEVLTAEFPIEILNEIRSVFGHLSQVYITEDQIIRNENIKKAEGHLDRATLDCFKYLCVAYHDKYIDFKNDYSKVDLSIIDNGKFLPNLMSKLKYAEDCFRRAKEAELNKLGKSKEDVVKLYEKAYLSYVDLYNFITDKNSYAETLLSKAKFKDNINNIGFIVGIVGLGLTIVSFVH